MKSNKLKLFFTAFVSTAVIVTPIVSLSSCSKQAPIYIDWKDKQKHLANGEQETSYTLKLTTKLKENEKVECLISDIKSSQPTFSVKITATAFAKDSDEVTTKVKIFDQTTNTIIKDGAKFSFSLTFTRKDADNKEITSTKINDFSIVYNAPTTTNLTLDDKSPEAKSNPGTGEHAFTFTVGEGIIADKTCKFECDVTTTECTTGLNITTNFKKAEYDENKLYLTFGLDKKDDFVEGNFAKFNFTVSCSKDGKELWRQSFKDYKITYIAHRMYIFEDYQVQHTYAGVQSFNLYVARDPKLHWDSNPKPCIEFTVTSPATGIQLEADEDNIEEAEGYLYSYFIIPVKITGATQDIEITYNANLYYKTDDGERFPESTHKDLTIKYATEKVTVKGDKTQTITGTKIANYQFSITNLFAQAKISCLLIAKNPTKEFTAEAAEYALIDEQNKVATVPVTVVTALTQGSIEFDLMLFGCDIYNDVVWEQLIEGYKIIYSK